MADTIPAHYATEFSTNWIQRAQQKPARLDAYVVEESFMGERKRFDRLDKMSSRKRTERKGPTNIVDASDDSRWIFRESYDVGNMLDAMDAKKLAPLLLPDGEYVQAHSFAFNRDKDDVAWKAALGSVITGELGTTVTPFPSSTQWIGKGGVVGASTGTATGLTVAKLITANRILQGADLDDDGTRVLVCTPFEIENLLNTTKVTSADYNTIKALVNGTIDTFMGFKFVINNRLPVATNVRTCVAWVKGAIKRSTGSKMSDISIRKDLSMAIQIYSSWELGATRVYDEGVIQIDCDESAAQPT